MLDLEVDHSLTTFEKLFKSREAVLKVRVQDRNLLQDIGLPITYDDYRKRLETHRYNPLLYAVEFPVLFSYLFGLLNFSLGTARNEVFIIDWRKLGTDRWNRLFVLKPRLDSSL